MLITLPVQASTMLYDGLGTLSKMSWDRMGYATKNTAKFRSRLISHTQLLSSFIQTSQVVIEQKLRKLIKEVQESKLGGSQLSVNSLHSLNHDERKRWRTIRKQLEAVGVTIAAFEENWAFIIDDIKSAIASGALEEKPPDSTPSARLRLRLRLHQKYKLQRQCKSLRGYAQDQEPSLHLHLRQRDFLDLGRKTVT